MEYESATHQCPNCPERMVLAFDSGQASPPFPSDWLLWAVHDHTEAQPIWRQVIFHHSARARYPQEAKDIKALQLGSRKAAQVAKQVSNDSKGKRRKGSVS